MTTALPAAPEPETEQLDRRSTPNNPRDDAAITAQTPQSAIAAMNSAYYNEADGRWSSSDAWWLTGNTLQAVLDYTNATGSREHLDRARHTIDSQKGVLPWWPQGNGLFRSDSTDDTGWWALALVRMYDVTGEGQYLDVARQDHEYLHGYWDAGGSCGGGIVWQVDPGRDRYKNAISNSLYVKLAASLAVRDRTRPEYLSRAVRGWEWFRDSGMINKDGLVNDGISEQCANNEQTTWTYNQGVILGALVELSRATGNSSYLEPARKLADAVMRSSDLTRDGILTETCEKDGQQCNADQGAFKGIFARNLAELDAVLDGRPYRSFLAKNAQSATSAARDHANNYGLRWAGPFDRSTVSSQSSAVGLLVAALGAT